MVGMPLNQTKLSFVTQDEKYRAPSESIMLFLPSEITITSYEAPIFTFRILLMQLVLYSKVYMI